MIVPGPGNRYDAVLKGRAGEFLTTLSEASSNVECVSRLRYDDGGATVDAAVPVRYTQFRIGDHYIPHSTTSYLTRFVLITVIK